MHLIKKINLYTLLTLLLVAAGSSHLVAQTTIGSDQPPAKGALLELTEGSTTSRGMMLPRVSLTSHSELKMGDNVLPVAEYANHIGLMVYNVNETEVCPSSLSMAIGMHVWDGTEWRTLTRVLGKDVKEYYDQDGNKFLARKFGTAGIWMTENLRAKTYDAVRDGKDPDNENMIGPAFNGDYQSDARYWAYPSPAESIDPTDTSLYDANPSLGLLYTWAAASRGQADQYFDEGGEGHPEHPVGIRQGICPSGWHLPTDKEWTLLENEIQVNTSKYSTMADIGGVETEIGENSTANLLSPLTDKCEPHTEWSAGTSKSKEKGGFASLFAGQIEGSQAVSYGQVSHYWTGSMNHYMVYARLIHVEQFGDENLQRVGMGRNTQASVRCKKNYDF